MYIRRIYKLNIQWMTFSVAYLLKPTSAQNIWFTCFPTYNYHIVHLIIREMNDLILTDIPSSMLQKLSKLSSCESYRKGWMAACRLASGQIALRSQAMQEDPQ